MLFCILAPPKITEDKYKDDILLKANTSTILEVPFTGSPQPKVTWDFNGGRLPDPKRTFSETIYNMTAFTINRAKMEYAGNFNLTLENPHGKVKLQAKVKVIDKPGPPKSLRVKDITESSVSLKWVEPDQNGGSAITNYVVEKREGHKKMWQKVGTCAATELNVTKLIEGNSYAFRVAAENEVGVGDPVDLGDVVTPKSQFGKQKTHLFILKHMKIHTQIIFF